MAASLLGTFAAAESAAGTATSGSRTTTSGSLIIGMGSAWTSGAGLVITDNQSNSYTEQHELEFSTEPNLVFAYNIGGTRAAGHTITCTSTPSGVDSTVGGLEFSGIDATPTVVSNTATGTSSSPSVSVTASVASLYVGMAGMDATTSITEDTGGGWSLGIEVDADNSIQVFNAQYKVSLSGANSASWTLGTSADWGAIVVAFEEAATGVTATPGAGTLATTGQTPRLLHDLPVASGSVALSGQSVRLHEQIAASAGVLALTGTAVALLHTFPVVAASLLVAGVSPTVVITGGVTSTPAQGELVLVGQGTSLHTAIRMPDEP